MATLFKSQPHLTPLQELRPFSHQMKSIVWIIRLRCPDQEPSDHMRQSPVVTYDDRFRTGVCINGEGIIMTCAEVVILAKQNGATIQVKQTLLDEYLGVEEVDAPPDAAFANHPAVTYLRVLRKNSTDTYAYGQVVEGSTRLAQEVLTIGHPSLVMHTPSVGTCCYHNSRDADILIHKDEVAEHMLINNFITDEDYNVVGAPVFDRRGGILGVITEVIKRICIAAKLELLEGKRKAEEDENQQAGTDDKGKRKVEEDDNQRADKKRKISENRPKHTSTVILS